MKRIILAAILTLAANLPAGADGLIIPRPQPWMPPNPTVNIKYHNVDVEINDPIALTRVDQAFINPYDREIEADYIFPIPDDAAISRFTAWLGGHQMEAELLDAAQARKIYEDIVRRRKDPALLEYSGHGMYRLRIYPIPAHSEVRIQIEYEQTLKSDNGTVEYLYPLNTEKYSGSNLEKCQVDIKVNSFENIGTLYSPTHSMKIDRLGNKAMQAVYSDENVKPSNDLIIYFTRQNKDFGFHILSFREPNNSRGFFLGILSPPLGNRLKETDKNIIFILDSSGSMRGEKMTQARDALQYCLRNLNPGDKFNIIDYDDAVRPFRANLAIADKANITDAATFVSAVEASGGTNIYDALAQGCGMIPGGSDPTYIIFLTDGQPTVGNTKIEDIIANTTRLNENRARLFVFGVGYDVNAHLLDRLSNENHGAPEYVLPNENIESKVSKLATRISRPALTDIALSFSGVRHVSDIYPAPMPDLFYGSEIVIAGRYDEGGSAQAIITGKIGGKDVTYEFPVNFKDGNDEFIALLWANRRIGYLLQQIRLHGSQNELLTEVIELSKKYGIITEYISFLVAGDEEMRVADVLGDNRKVVNARRPAMEHYMAPQTGAGAVAQSQSLNKQATTDQVMRAGSFEMNGQTQSVNTVTQVGSQAFFRLKDNWVQGGLTGDKYDLAIKRFSQAYFQLLDKDPSLGRYLGLGNQVRLKIGTQVVQIGDSGQESLSDRELSALFPK